MHKHMTLRFLIMSTLGLAFKDFFFYQISYFIWLAYHFCTEKTSRIVSESHWYRPRLQMSVFLFRRTNMQFLTLVSFLTPSHLTFFVTFFVPLKKTIVIFPEVQGALDIN